MNSLGTCTIDYLQQLSSHPWPPSIFWGDGQERILDGQRRATAFGNPTTWTLCGGVVAKAMFWEPLFCVTWILGERCNDADKLKLCEVWGFFDTEEREVKEMEMTELWPVLRLDISVSSIACCWKIFKMQATTAIYHLYIWCAYIYIYIYIHFLFTSTQIYQPTNPSIYLWIIYRLAVQLHSE